MSTLQHTPLEAPPTAPIPVPPEPGQRGRWGRRAPFLILLAVMVILIVVPIVVLMITAVTDSPPRPGDPLGNFTLENFSAIFTPRGLSAALNSLIISVSAGTLALIVGTAL